MEGLSRIQISTPFFILLGIAIGAVISTVDVTDALSAVYSSTFYDDDNNAYYVDPANSGTSAIMNGNIGVGTTSPNGAVTVNGFVDFIDLSGTGSGINFLDGTSQTSAAPTTFERGCFSQPDLGTCLAECSDQGGECIYGTTLSCETTGWGGYTDGVTDAYGCNRDHDLYCICGRIK